MKTSADSLVFSHIMSKKIIFATTISLGRNGKTHIYQVNLTVSLDNPIFDEEFYINPGAESLMNEDNVTCKYIGFGSLKFYNFDKETDSWIIVILEPQ